MVMEVNGSVKEIAYSDLCKCAVFAQVWQIQHTWANAAHLTFEVYNME